jgi:intracellular sulfur oxidation DsrE/DsrF family protein
MNCVTHQSIASLLRALVLLFAVFGAFVPGISIAEETVEEEAFPEQSEIDRILSGDKPPGILFLVMEHDEEALNWVLPRIVHYTAQIREKWPDLNVAVLSHGDEMLALVYDLTPLYPGIHQNVYDLVNTYNVYFHVCGTFAEMSGYSPSEFPDYVDVVPFGPAQIQDYRGLDYRVLSIEPTW